MQNRSESRAHGRIAVGSLQITQDDLWNLNGICDRRIGLVDLRIPQSTEALEERTLSGGGIVGTKDSAAPGTVCVCVLK